MHDVIKWKNFPCNWPFVRGIHQSPACDYLAMLGFKLTHVSKRGLCWPDILLLMNIGNRVMFLLAVSPWQVNHAVLYCMFDPTWHLLFPSEQFYVYLKISGPNENNTTHTDTILRWHKTIYKDIEVDTPVKNTQHLRLHKNSKQLRV